MNLKAKNTRSYEEITNEAEKYIQAAIEALEGKHPTAVECESIAAKGNEHEVTIVINGKEEVTLEIEGDKIKLIRNGESVILNDEDAAQVQELLISKIFERAGKKEKAVSIIAKLAALPLVIADLQREGKDLTKLTCKDIDQLIEAKIKEVVNED